MRVSKAILFIIISVCLFSLTGCGDPAPKANTNTNTAVTNTTVKTNSGNMPTGFESTTKPEEAKTNEGQSIAPVIQAYYSALKTKDDKSLRAILSQSAIKELDANTKSEGKKSISDYITASEPVGEKPFEVRNEKIEGNSAIAEIRGGSYTNWVKWKFVKEGGVWKKDAPSEDLKLFGK